MESRRIGWCGMTWLFAIGPFAGIGFIAWLFVSHIIPQLQKAVGA